MVSDIINDIIIAKNNKAYISALSLSLTLPNILSNIEYGEKTHRAEYIEWFNKWVFPYYKQPPSENEYINQGIENCKFDGVNCYALRCALLHSGNNDLICNKGRIHIFSLRIADEHSQCGDVYICDAIPNPSNIYVSIDVEKLIDSIIAGAQEYIANNEDKITTNNDLYCGYGSICIEYI